MNAARRALAALAFTLLATPGALAVAFGVWLVFAAVTARTVDARITSVYVDPSNSDRSADYEYIVSGKTCAGTAYASEFEHPEQGLREPVYVASDELCLASPIRADLVLDALGAAWFGGWWMLLAGARIPELLTSAQALSSAQRAVSR